MTNTQATALRTYISNVRETRAPSGFLPKPANISLCLWVTRNGIPTGHRALREPAKWCRNGRALIRISLLSTFNRIKESA